MAYTHESCYRPNAGSSNFNFFPLLHHFKYPINAHMFWLGLPYLHEVTFQPTLSPVASDTSL